MKKSLLYGLGLFAILLLGSATMLSTKNIAKAQVAYTCPTGSYCLLGWAWSSNIGWVSVNSYNRNSGTGGASYGVSFATSSANSNLATFTGYAWSPNIGWISFNPSDITSTNCPTGSGCTPTVNLSTGVVSGWARALSVTDSNSADGWIELAGVNHVSTTSSSGGVVFVPSSGTWSGYAYEPSAIGWLDFEYITSPSIAKQGQVAPTLSLLGQDQYLGTYIANPTVYANASGVATDSFQWTSSNVTSVTTGTSNWGSSVGTSKALSGSQVLSFTNSSASPITAVVTLNGVGSDASNLSSTVTVTIDPYNYTPPVTTCSVPVNASLCGGSNTNGSSVTINAYGSCPTTSIGSCQFQCNSGYALKGGKCVKASTSEI